MRNRVQISRSVGYSFELSRDDPRQFDEAAVEAALVRAVNAGVVYPGQYDTGRGRIVWFNGRPGPGLRAVRQEIKRLVEQAK